MAGSKYASSARLIQKCRRREGRVPGLRASTAPPCWARPSLLRLSGNSSSIACYENSARLESNLSGKLRQSEFTPQAPAASNRGNWLGSRFAGRGQNFRCLERSLVRRGDHQENRRQNHGGSQRGAQRNRFAGSQPAEKKRHDGIDERVSSDSRRRALFQKIHISRKAESRPKYHQVRKGDPRARRNGPEMKLAAFARKQSHNPKGGPARDALHGHA